MAQAAALCEGVPAGYARKISVRYDYSIHYTHDLRTENPLLETPMQDCSFAFPSVQNRRTCYDDTDGPVKGLHRFQFDFQLNFHTSLFSYPIKQNASDA